jgi:hypothetical protein
VKRPLETASFACALFAAAVGVISLGLFLLSIFGLVLSGNWEGFGFRGLLQSLGAVVYYPLLLLVLSLVFAGLQAWIDAGTDD